MNMQPHAHARRYGAIPHTIDDLLINLDDQFARKGLLFLPLGAVFALLSRDVYAPGGMRRVLAVASGAGLAVEAGRYFLPARTASVTDVLIGCAGAGFGYLAARHVRATVWSERVLFGRPVVRPAVIDFRGRAVPPVPRPRCAAAPARGWPPASGA